MMHVYFQFKTGVSYLYERRTSAVLGKVSVAPRPAVRLRRIGAPYVTERDNSAPEGDTCIGVRRGRIS